MDNNRNTHRLILFDLIFIENRGRVAFDREYYRSTTNGIRSNRVIIYSYLVLKFIRFFFLV